MHTPRHAPSPALVSGTQEPEAQSAIGPPSRAGKMAEGAGERPAAQKRVSGAGEGGTGLSASFHPPSDGGGGGRWRGEPDRAGTEGPEGTRVWGRGEGKAGGARDRSGGGGGERSTSRPPRSHPDTDSRGPRPGSSADLRKEVTSRPPCGVWRRAASNSRVCLRSPPGLAPAAFPSTAGRGAHELHCGCASGHCGRDPAHLLPAPRGRRLRFRLLWRTAVIL